MRILMGIPHLQLRMAVMPAKPLQPMRAVPATVLGQGQGAVLSCSYRAKQGIHFLMHFSGHHGLSRSQNGIWLKIAAV